MDILEVKIDTAKLGGQLITNKMGKRYICIPAEQDCIYIGSKGIYLTLSGIERAEEKDGQTHFLKPYISTEKFKAMSQDDKRAVPIVGNIKKMAKLQNEMEAKPAADAGLEDLPF